MKTLGSWKITKFGENDKIPCQGYSVKGNQIIVTPEIYDSPLRILQTVLVEEFYTDEVFLEGQRKERLKDLASQIVKFIKEEGQ